MNEIDFPSGLRDEEEKTLSLKYFNVTRPEKDVFRSRKVQVVKQTRGTYANHLIIEDWKYRFCSIMIAIASQIKLRSLL